MVVKKGVLEVFCGPMKCGKTRELIHRVDKFPYIEAGFRFIKPTIDTRDKNITSRFLGQKFTYECDPVDPKNPEEILNYINGEHDLVAIDEAQFFSGGLVQVVEHLLQQDKNVVIGGLELDFRGEPFGPMPYLLTIADEVTKLTAVCEYNSCKSLANRTQRLINGEPAHYTAPLVSIEGSTQEESYQARCLKHHEVPGKPILL